VKDQALWFRLGKEGSRRTAFSVIRRRMGIRRAYGVASGIAPSPGSGGTSSQAPARLCSPSALPSDFRRKHPGASSLLRTGMSRRPGCRKSHRSVYELPPGRGLPSLWR
jgi:hypothetical protein